MAEGEVIKRALRAWGLVPRVLVDVFETADADAVASAVSTFCEQHLGARVARYVLFAGGVGTVHGLELTDGRRVALKAHRGDVDLAYLHAVQVTQSALVAGGAPAPRPLLAPTAIRRGVATVEELLEEGSATCAHDATQRLRMATDLHRFVELATPHRAAFGAHTGFLTGAGKRLYPNAHDRRFDLTLPGADWIDALARDARTILTASRCPAVVGHSDWRVENLRYRNGTLRAIYDWDSLVVRPEAALVGAVAGLFTTDWTQIDRCGIPSVGEMTAFVTAYETARAQPFTAAERDLARAALIYQTAYNARCEWSDLLTDMGRRPASAVSIDIGDDGFLTRLADLSRVSRTGPA